MNRDSYGIIGQIKGPNNPIEVEGGDSVNWEGHWIYLNNGRDPGGKIVKTTSRYVSFFEVGFGAYARHPKKSQTKHGFGAYYKNPWQGCISRDQLRGILAALISGGEYLAMLRLILHHALRGFIFAYNTIENGDDPDTAPWKLPDLTGPDIWAMELRGFGLASWLFWPILCLLDIYMLFNAVFHNHKETQHVISFSITLLVCVENVPTPTSLLAKYVIDRDELLSELYKYWCNWRESCEIYHAYEKRLNAL